MNHLSNDKRDEIEYQFGVKQRKEDAKKHMKHSSRIMNGELRQSIGDNICQSPKKENE